VPISLEELVRATLQEDAADRDITAAACIAADARCRARLIAKQDGVLSGMRAFRCAFDLCDAQVSGYAALSDGKAFKRGDVLAELNGLTRGVLSAERTALNFVQHLSGIATLTAAFVKEVSDTNARICDTRKTMPLLRALAKEAVRHGGGSNHRFNLGDGALIKENHVMAAGGVKDSILLARSHAHHLLRVEVEVSTFEGLKEAIAAGADVVMLDNMDTPSMREAVSIAAGSGVLLEASGNMSLDRVREVAETGVDFISVGALTHSAPAADLSLLIENA